MTLPVRLGNAVALFKKDKPGERRNVENQVKL